jgi:hypothetical protein
MDECHDLIRRKVMRDHGGHGILVPLRRPVGEGIRLDQSDGGIAGGGQSTAGELKGVPVLVQTREFDLQAAALEPAGRLQRDVT